MEHGGPHRAATLTISGTVVRCSPDLTLHGVATALADRHPGPPRAGDADTAPPRTDPPRVGQSIWPPAPPDRSRQNDNTYVGSVASVSEVASLGTGSTTAGIPSPAFSLPKASTPTSSWRSSGTRPTGWTMDTYAHVLPAGMREAAEAMDRAFAHMMPTSEAPGSEASELLGSQLGSQTPLPARRAGPPTDST